MNDLLLKLYVKFQALKNDERGQDLIEYALVAAVIAVGAIFGMKTLTNAINAKFVSIGTTVTTP